MLRDIGYRHRRLLGYTVSEYFDRVDCGELNPVNS